MSQHTYPAGAGPRSSIERVRAALGDRVRKSANIDDFLALCPVHDEDNASLHVTWRVDVQRGGLVLLNCFGCQAPAADIADALGLQTRDLFDEPPPERDLQRSITRVGKRPEIRRAAARRGKQGALPKELTRTADGGDPAEHQWTETSRYVYTDRDGNPVQEVVRQECACPAEPKRHKRFTQVYVTGTGRKLTRKPEGFRPVLYRAPQVAAAVAEGREVWLVEGEKDVHTAEALGLAATTNAAGAGQFPADLAEDLRGARVAVVLDRDPAGWNRGVTLHALLTGAGCAVRLLLPDIDTAKADLTDHVEAGKPLEGLQQVHVDEVKVWQALTGAETAERLVRRAVDESRAHLELADAGQDPEDHRSKAARWAIEAQIKQEELRTAHDKVQAMGIALGTVWADQAMQRAEQLLANGTAAARQCHDDADVPVPESLQPAQPGAAAPAGRPWKQMGTATADDPFRVLDGRIVQWQAPRGRRAGEEEAEGSTRTLLSTVVKLVGLEYVEAEESGAGGGGGGGRRGRARAASRRKPEGSAVISAVRLQYPHPATGEWLEIRVAAEAWHDHSWLRSLPGKPDFDGSRNGLDRVQRAIRAISEDVVEEVIYRSTGWREDPDGGWRYIHDGGAITAAGQSDANTDFHGTLANYDLPDPVHDPHAVREAWLQGSAAMLDRLPDRVAAPLLGAVFRAAIDHNPWNLALVGPPGSCKTSVAAKAMHHFGESWDRDLPGSSMSGNGDTLNAIRIKLHNAKDALYWLDDFAPTRSWLKAQELLEETARLIHNREGRGRSSRDGQAVSGATAPRASGLFTSEVMPRPGASAGERMLVVPLAREDVDTDLLFPLDEPESRFQRALVMASYISWLAADLPGRRARTLSEASEYSAERVREEGPAARRTSDALGSYWSGWVAVTDFLRETGAITDDEADQTLRRVDAALREAGCAAVNPDVPRSTGARVRELIQHALRDGLAYVTDVRTGGCPPWPMAESLGWRRSSAELDHHGLPARIRQDHKTGAIWLGYVMHDAGPDDPRGNTLMCFSTALEPVLRAAAAPQSEKFEIDRDTAARALDEEGVLLPDRSEPGKVRRTLKCTIHCKGKKSERMYVLRLEAILGGGDGDDPTTGRAILGGGDGDDPTTGRAILGGGDGDDPTTGGCCPHCGTGTGTSTGTSTVRTGTTAADGAPPPAAAAGVAGAPQQVDAGDAGGHTGTGGVAGAAAGTDHPDEKGTTMRRTSRPAQTPDVHRAAAAVVDTGGMWLSNGEHLPWPDGQLPRHAGDLVSLAHRLRLGGRGAGGRADNGQIWVGDDLAREMGIDVDAISAAGTKERAAEVVRTTTAAGVAVSGALDAGYVVGSAGVPGLRPWTRLWRDEGGDPGVWIVLLAAVRLDEGMPLLQGRPDHAVLAHRIGLVADAMGGFAYRLSAATTGMDLMTGLRWKDLDRFFPKGGGMCEPAAELGMAGEVDINWCRPPTQEESGHEWLHMYDRSGSYLAGAASLELGFGPAVHHPEGIPFDKRLPGYWRIRIPQTWDWRMPNPLDPAGQVIAGDWRWFTTPGVAFAQELGFEPEVREAWTWAEHGRALEPWYERLRDARTMLDIEDPDLQLARDVIKQIYTRTIGMMGSSVHWAQRRGYHPDWRHHIVAKARTNILRRVHTIGEATGRWPLAITTDSVVYSSPDPDPVTAWPGGAKTLGRHLGGYKPEASIRLADHRAWLVGGTYNQRPAGETRYRSGRDALLGGGVRHGPLP